MYVPLCCCCCLLLLILVVWVYYSFRFGFGFRSRSSFRHDYVLLFRNNGIVVVVYQMNEKNEYNSLVLAYISNKVLIFLFFKKSKSMMFP